MADFNRVIIIGNLTRDPEHRPLPSGQNVCRLGIASNRQYRNKQTGSMVQEVCFIDVDVWGPQAESCKQYLQKGRPVLIEGRLKLDSWQDASGQSRSKHSIVADRVVFLGSNASAGAEMEEGDMASLGAAQVDSTVSPQLEKDLLDQIDQIKNRAKRAKPKKDDELPQVGFKDEPPFQDDLPF